MANRRGTEDDTSSPSVEGNNRTANFASTSVNNQPRDNDLRANESSHSTGMLESSREARCEQNPFSFKHFLRKDSRPNYNLSGARPKVYSPARSGPSVPPSVAAATAAAAAASSEGDAIYPCNPTELPDFVQDHLVIEQCYLNQGSSSVPPVADNIGNLPDFAISHSERHCANGKRTTMTTTTTTTTTMTTTTTTTTTMTTTTMSAAMTKTTTSRTRKEADRSVVVACATPDLPFDLTGGLERRNRNNSATCNVSAAAATHHLPVYSRPNQLPVRQAETTTRNAHRRNLPFDLPPSASRDSSSANANPVGAANSPTDEIVGGVNKTLPDFLNDGPIRNRVGAGNNENDSSLDMPERPPDTSHLALENETLRAELKIARRHITDKTMMIESLRSELTSRRAVDQDESAHLEKAMEQVEVNLKRRTKRASNAENAVTLLKQQVKALTAELSSLRTENRELRSTAGAGGGADYRLPATEKRIKELSAELRAAATTAEFSLRQLMSGVNNLKAMASALENINGTEDRTKDSLPEFEEENAAGPAL